MCRAKLLLVVASGLALGCARSAPVQTAPDVCDGQWRVEVTNRFDQPINVDHTVEGEAVLLGEVWPGETKVFRPDVVSRPLVTVRAHEDYYPAYFQDRSAGLIGISVYCQPAAAVEATPAAEVDHIIVPVPNLQEGMRLFEEATGVRPVFGGQHPASGTQNALVSLGPRTYLELLAPQTPPEPAERLDMSDLKPRGWASSTESLMGMMEWLQGRGYGTSALVSGSRARPDGATLMWTTVGIADPQIAGAPFFIRWGETSEHPAATSPTGCELHSLTVRTPDADRLERLVRGLGLEVTVEPGDGPAADLEVALVCPSGPVILH